jgi:site-specific recombinase XerD
MRLAAAFGAFLVSLDGVKSPATVTWYRARLASLAPFLGDIDIASITVHDLRRWRSTFNGHVSVLTMHGNVRACRRFFHWLEDEGLLSCSPARRLELPRKPKGRARGITHEDLRAMLTAAAGIGEKELALCWFFYSTGARRGGVVNLQLADLHLDRGFAYVHEKNDKTRMVPLLPEAVEAMRAYLAVRPAGLGGVFLGKRGSLSGSGVYRVLERVAKAAGVVGEWNPHSFRHRRARDWLAAGSPLSVVSQGLGHSGLAVTADIYGVLPDEQVNGQLLQVGLPGFAL